ncbi:uncharacterized protein MONBRDRAFT_37009 [Monosiga brevicollis MX1]|uniref:Uncharacterized protein n=1 Tax=Monosiga brevicollis TaxID=81824 RepID=A9UZ03_MONBE|nr:uncharacterized protein MONBRDRAFT_37009 [Monosiga brevicollis MX1]EDQ89548.1 predicted protein [Monosiga brevicollis MX1]|eukprot:XP_001745577.1 hypothetical protein [Monosiga brevicollis MX1]
MTTRQTLHEYKHAPGNQTCADCGVADTSWASTTLGIFICVDCSGIHRSLGVQISKVKSLKLDQWASDEAKQMAVGNLQSNEKYEACVPRIVLRPSGSCPTHIRNSYIRAKYSELLFTDRREAAEARAQLLSGSLEGLLLKQGKSNGKWLPRHVVLADGTLKYHASEGDAEEKGSIPILQALCTVVVPGCDQEFVFNILYDNRMYYFKASSAMDYFRWITSIRAARARAMGWDGEREDHPMLDKVCPISEIAQGSYPLLWRSASHLANLRCLHTDQALQLLDSKRREGVLSKAGPNMRGMKARYFILHERTLAYFGRQQDAEAKGVIVLGPPSRGFKVCRDNSIVSSAVDGCCIRLTTPDRDYAIQAETEEEAKAWENAISTAINTLPVY